MEDLDSLLQQIDELDAKADESIQEPAQPPESFVESDSIIDPDDPILNKRIDEKITIVDAQDDIKVNLDIIPTEITPVVQAEEPLIDIKKYLNKLDTVTDSILESCNADRLEAQDIINMYRREIDSAITNSRQPQRMFVDGLVKALEVKSNVNMTAVKALEATAKMIATTKAGSSVQVNNLNVGPGNSSDLESVLALPLSQDDEY
jgi:hypothetical protein